jgi:hypothetical protein
MSQQAGASWGSCSKVRISRMSLSHHGRSQRDGLLTALFI